MRMLLRSDLLYYAISKEVDKFDMFYNNIYQVYLQHSENRNETD